MDGYVCDMEAPWNSISIESNSRVKGPYWPLLFIEKIARLDMVQVVRVFYVHGQMEWPKAFYLDGCSAGGVL